MRRRRLLTTVEKTLRREASNYGRRAIGAIQRAVEHEAEYRGFVTLATRAKLDPEKTNAPLWRAKANQSQDVAVRLAKWAAHEANEALRIAAGLEG